MWYKHSAAECHRIAYYFNADSVKRKLLQNNRPLRKRLQNVTYLAVSIVGHDCTFKLLERIVLTRITPVVDPFIPQAQAGFRPQRNATEQVLALTSHIETGYEKKMKTGAIFIDLSAAYDTVSHTVSC